MQPLSTICLKEGPKPSGGYDQFFIIGLQVLVFHADTRAFIEDPVAAEKAHDICEDGNPEGERKAYRLLP